MVTDTIADFLTRNRNAQMAGHRIVEIPASNLKKRMTEILYNQGYILKYKFEDDNKQGVIKIALKYHPATKQSAIKKIAMDRPGVVLLDLMMPVMNGRQALRWIRARQTSELGANEC